MSVERNGMPVDQKPPAEGWRLVHAGDLGRGDCFVKRTAGANGFAYLVAASSHFRAVGLHGKSEEHVYGVCYNGNMTAILKHQFVWLVPFEQMVKNRKNEAAWDATFARPES